MNTLTQSQANKLFCALMMFHVLWWTSVALLSRQHLPMDSLEVVNWGQTLLWGYDRNPYLNAWLARGLMLLSGGADWVIYLGSSLAVAVSLWAVYRVAIKLLSPAQAFISVLMLMGLQFYHLAAVEFNDNLLELLFWPLMVSFYYTALYEHKSWHWMWVGLFAGFALMSKYLSVVMIVPLLGWLCLKPHRFVFKQPIFYIGILIAVVIVLPHIVWLFDNHFMTWRYARNRMGEFTWLAHFTHPGLFLFKSFLYVLPCLMIARLSMSSLRGASLLSSLRGASLLSSLRGAQRRSNLPPFHFITLVAFAPFILVALISLFTGSRVTSMWTQPFFAWVGVWLMMFLQQPVEWAGLKRSLSVTCYGLLVLGVGQIVSLKTAGQDSSANYNGRALAQQIEAIWAQYSDEPLAYVAGDRVFSGSVAHYGSSHAKAFYDFNPDLNPWVDLDDVYAKGAIVMWREDKPYKTLQNRHLFEDAVVYSTTVDEGHRFYVGVILPKT